jgi:acetyl-CoA/propionyl-CoA carboxylase biotin carboxyl carrier protein
MQATVVRVMVETGATVIAGDIVCVLEAMKMEQPIIAHQDGTVISVSVAVGDSVSGGQSLFAIE